MTTVCEKNMCAGCMACLDVCGKSAIQIIRGLDAYNAVIDADKCVNCGLCHNICQKNHPAALQKPISWHEGWSSNAKQRERSSSGGLAAEIERGFIRQGGLVCSCCIQHGEVGFAFAENLDEIDQFAGSKYVKSNPAGIYKKIKEKLRRGQKVLFVGLPCQTSAVLNFVGEQLKNNLYTVDLICHGSPDPDILRKYLKSSGMKLDDVVDLQFRQSNVFALFNQGKKIEKGTQDTYTTAFLRSLDYTENCYSCEYAKLERVSDISLGDSWATEQMNEKKRGVSLVLCQTEKGEKLLQAAEVTLFSVDIQKAIDSNGQLRAPSKCPAKRKRFIQTLQHGRSLNHAMLLAEPITEIKNKIKRILGWLGLRE